MRLQVKGKNIEVTESIRSYAIEKLGKLERQLNDQARVELELAVERNPSIAANHIAEATVWTKGPVLRARESSSDMRAAIDELSEKLVRQVGRYREKRNPRSGHRHAEPARSAEMGEDMSSAEPMIVKTKRFPVKPMNPEEAVLQLELIGHDFFVFRNADSLEVNVVYRRRDGAYGLIEPEA
jgi:putative sigma-54 modulation protein